MKLYYAPGVCSLSPHVVLREAGLDFELERVDLAAKKTETGADYRPINPKGYVPALQLDDGQVLTEGAAIVQYVADSRPEARLAPPAGTLERARVQEHLNFVASELHQAFSPLFSPATSAEAKDAARARVRQRLDDIERMLSDGRRFLTGDQFTVADAYLFVVAGWAKPTEIGLASWPNVEAFVSRVGEREAVRAALRAEGLA
ncbi:MAG TPA: glutathione transferase GstA [Geminicoccaceae bacterium]|nr:glutathione transferase GstA [Geminicoccaceae bacterium]